MVNQIKEPEIMHRKLLGLMLVSGQILAGGLYNPYQDLRPLDLEEISKPYYTQKRVQNTVAKKWPGSDSAKVGTLRLWSTDLSQDVITTSTQASIKEIDTGHRQIGNVKYSQKYLNKYKGWIQNVYDMELAALYTQQPQVKAFLDIISYSEGAAYRTAFGGSPIASLKRFSCKATKHGRYTSTACGRYQLLDITYKRVAKKLGITNFSKRSQDIIALELIKERGAYEDILRGNIEQAIYKTAWEWASFPCGVNRKSCYGQPTRNIEQLLKAYKHRLYMYQNNACLLESARM